MRYSYVVITKWEAIMSDSSFGEFIHPLHCRVSGSKDKKQIALTFQSQERTPFTIVLPLTGAVGLQRNLAQSLYIITAKPVPVEDKATAEPAPSLGA
jgi:hypothetical protein